MHTDTAHTETSTDAQRLIEKIMDDARARAANIDDERVHEVAKIDMETDVLVKERERALIKEALRARETRNRRENADIAVDNAKMLLARKQALVDSACKKAEDAMAKIARKERDRIIMAHWRHASATMDIDHVDAAHHDASFFARRTKVRMTNHWQGGFIAYAKGRRISYDARFETLLADIRTRSVGDIATILFGAPPTMQRQERKQKRKRSPNARARSATTLTRRRA